MGRSGDLDNSFTGSGDPDFVLESCFFQPHVVCLHLPFTEGFNEGFTVVTTTTVEFEYAGMKSKMAIRHHIHPLSCLRLPYTYLGLLIYSGPVLVPDFGASVYWEVFTRRYQQDI
jgi:hypothetical protein